MSPRPCEAPTERSEGELSELASEPVSPRPCEAPTERSEGERERAEAPVDRAPPGSAVSPGAAPGAVAGGAGP
jgi:hypothetical protein